MEDQLFEQLHRGLEYYRRVRESVRKEASRLRRFGGVRLSVKEQNGTMYYTAVWQRGEVRERKYLGKADREDVRLIQRRYYCSKAASILDLNIEELERCLRGMERIDPMLLVSRLPKAYRNDDFTVYAIDNSSEDGKAWESRQPRPPFREEDTLFRTNRGELVRSKTELVIANELASRGISYVYETVRYINGKRCRPDFVIYYQGKEIIWEHFGMMDDPDYFSDNVEKLLNYLNAGYYPNYNFITTFERTGKELDSMLIGRIIDLWFPNPDAGRSVA